MNVPAEPPSTEVAPSNCDFVSRLPPELLCEVFTQSTRDDPDTLTSIPQVCQQWREIATGMPFLWSSLDIIIDESSCIPTCSIVETWIHHSGSLPLSLSFSITHWDESNDVIITAIMSFLISHVHHWRSFKFYCTAVPPELAGMKYLQCPGSIAPMLEHLSVMNPREVQIELLFSILHLAPRLQTFHGFVPRCARIPWHQLTDLVLRNWVGVDTCLNVLRYTPLLVSANFDILASSIVPPLFIANPCGTGNLPENPDALLTLCRLRSLNIRIDGGLGLFFNGLTSIPSLETLHIHQRCGIWTPWPESQFMSLLTRSSFSLTCLNVHDLSIAEENLIDLFRRNSFIAELKISHWNERHPSCITDTILKSLTHMCPQESEASSACLLPNLRTISLQGLMLFSDGVLADMVESRWKAHPTYPIARLSCVCYCSPNPRPVDDHRLKAMGEKGLCVSEKIHFPVLRLEGMVHIHIEPSFISYD